MDSINRGDISKVLFKNTGIIAVGQISTKIINFFLLPLYTALLSKEEYGTIDLLSTYSSFLTVIVGVQFNQAAFRFLVTNREDKKKTEKVVSTILLTALVTLAIYCTLFLVVQPFLTVGFKWFLLLHVAASIYLQICSGMARGMGDNISYAVGNFLSATITLVINVLVVAVFHMGIESMLMAYIIGPVIGGTYVLERCKILKYFFVLKAEKGIFRAMMQYALPLIPNELSWSLLHSSDRFIVSNMLTVAANGLVAVASKFSAIYTTVFSIFNTSWTEQVVLHYKDRGGKEYISDMFDKMVTFFGTVAVAIIVCMPFVFRLLVNQQFEEAYGMIPIYMMAVFFNAIIGMISAIYLIENETKIVAVSTGVAALINIVTDVALINFIGVYAAPVSSLCGYAVISFWRLFDVNKRHCKIQMKKSNIIFLLIACAISCISFYVEKICIHVLALLAVSLIGIKINQKFFRELKQMVPFGKR